MTKKITVIGVHSVGHKPPEVKTFEDRNEAQKWVLKNNVHIAQVSKPRKP